MVAEKVISQKQSKRVNVVSNEDVTDENDFKWGIQKGWGALVIEMEGTY